MDSITLRIDGMHCGACVHRVTQALQKAQGAEVQEVRVGAARVEAPDAAQTAPVLIELLAKAGFSAHVEQ